MQESQAGGNTGEGRKAVQSVPIYHVIKLCLHVRSSWDSNIKESQLRNMAGTMMKSVGVKEDQEITFEQFKRIVLQRGTIFHKLSLETRTKKKELQRTFSLVAMKPIRSEDTDIEEEEEDEEGIQKPTVANRIKWWYNGLVNEVRSKVQFAFWLVLYTLVMLLIFAERAYFFS